MMKTEETVVDALLASLAKAADHNREDAEAPAAVLWPDEKRDWERVIPRLRSIVPHLLVLGDYEPGNRTGPAIWLRCALAGKVPELALPPGMVPIIYLGGVSRSVFRHPEVCPNELKPLFEVQFRGAFWSQANGKDWTITAFLQTNHGGLQLKLAKDQATASATRRALEKLLDVPVAELRAKSASGELNSNYFDLLVRDDPVDDLLSWLADPGGTRKRWDAGRWEALLSYCAKECGIDPARDGPLVGVEHLGRQSKTAWKAAWKRFAAAPTRYLGLVEQLRRAKPKEKGGPLFNQPEEFWPQDNESAEAALRQSLADVISAPLSAARTRLIELDSAHKQRREWVWARLKLAPLALAVEHLWHLAEATRAPLTGASVADMTTAYIEHGWQADAAVLDALAAVSSSQDREVVAAAIAAVYSPWLRDAAELFQERARQEPLPGRSTARLAEVASGTCLLFADGLRFDLAQKVKQALEAKQIAVQLRHQFVALPSVTPTSKPAVSPVAGKLTGSTACEEFCPTVDITGYPLGGVMEHHAERDDYGSPSVHDADRDSYGGSSVRDAEQDKNGGKLDIQRFRKLLEEEGYQVLDARDVGEPAGRAWTEFGDLDKRGHELGIGLARAIPELLTNLVERVESLLAAGWREVRIVTDHGWLLVPGGLPKTDLPKYLTATRWGRCAVVKPAATIDLPCFSWFWSDDVRIACPPGIDSFIAGKEYGHGGLSLQECIVPQLTVQAGTGPVVSARIESFKWAGLRCRVKVDGGFENCRVDLRDKAADASTSLVGDAKPIAKDGTVSLVIEPELDSRDGTPTHLVLLDPGGNVIEKLALTVGG
jgi:hypothetical protein